MLRYVDGLPVPEIAAAIASRTAPPGRVPPAMAGPAAGSYPLTAEEVSEVVALARLVLDG